MELNGEYRIAAPREAVWKALNDADVLKQCIPGCESIDKASDTEFSAKVRAKVGPVSAGFTGKVTLSDLDPPNGYKISGEGQGGVAGFAKGGADVRLKPDESGSGTILTYAVQANVGGKIAQIGSRLIEGTARSMADQFFAKLAEIVTQGAGPAEAAPAATAAAAAAPAAAATAQAGLSPRIWVTLLIAIVLLLLIYFGVFA
ncbi:MAG TPA: carbon monoxide dehydrogenase subunit G [Dongiaceae bacterium]|jgi:carbon monoxide dehydrogenase subunit G